MFESTAQLPQPVRENLDSTLQELYRSSYNLSEIVTKSPNQATKDAWTTVLRQNDAAKGFWVDVSGIQFNEEAPTWIQAMPLGTYEHPVYKKIEITPEKVARLAENVKKGVRGQDLDIDFEHKSYSGEAAGWVKDAEARPDGLWLLVEWTKKAFEDIKNKAYRYFSPEYNDVWEDPRTKQKHKDVLFGGALTNRPFLKGITPINLSEVLDYGQDDKPKQGDVMTPEQIKKLAKLAGLGEDATQEQVLEALEKKADEPAPASTPVAPATPVVTTTAPETVAASEALKKLAETNSEVKSLLEAQAQRDKRIAILESANRLSEINVKLNDWAKSRKFGLPASTHDDIRRYMLSASVEQSKALESILDKITDVGLVQMGESTYRPAPEFKNATEEFNGRVTKLLTENPKLEEVDAITQVSAADPALFDQYRREAFSTPLDQS